MYDKENWQQINFCLKQILSLSHFFLNIWFIQKYILHTALNNPGSDSGVPFIFKN